MNFEALPNEIILDLFEYLSLEHLFHGFHSLDSRFTKLLTEEFRQFHLDCRSMSETELTSICQLFVPSIPDGILSVHLSDDDDTPQQIEFFISLHHFQLRQFTRLQSLSLSHLQPQQTLDRLMVECADLPCLTHPTIVHGSIPMNNTDVQRFHNQIWKLPKLIYCFLDLNQDYYNPLPSPSHVSASLHNLTIGNLHSSLSTFSHLSQFAPSLQSLSLDFYDHSEPVAPLPLHLSLTRLQINIRFNTMTNTLPHLFESVPNLHHLILESYTIYIDGYQWEAMIRNYLHHLQILQFKLRLSVSVYLDGHTKTILDSFRSQFWTTEHQWFVRCYEHLSDDESNEADIDVFTVPYASKEFTGAYLSSLGNSTCSDSDDYLICDQVRYLKYYPLHFSDFSLSGVRFRHLRSLSLYSPIDEQLFSKGPNFEELTSLQVFVDSDESLDTCSQLQFILDRAPSLRSLTFSEWAIADSPVPPMDLTNASVRRLDVRGYNHRKAWRCFDQEQCIELSRSPLGVQCRTLLIRVQTRRSISDLLNNMPNLQSLNVECEDDYWTKQDDSMEDIDNELVGWLREQLPFTCVTRETFNSVVIRIWIR